MKIYKISIMLLASVFCLQNFAADNELDIPDGGEKGKSVRDKICPRPNNNRVAVAAAVARAIGRVSS